jgi:hypothetical protein
MIDEPRYLGDGKGPLGQIQQLPADEAPVFEGTIRTYDGPFFGPMVAIEVPADGSWTTLEVRESA